MVDLAPFHHEIAADLLPRDFLPRAPPAPSSTSSDPPSSPLGGSLIDDDPSHSDGLVVLARGLGVRPVLTAFLKIHAHRENLVLLLNTAPRELALLREDLTVAALACDIGGGVGGDDTGVPVIDVDCFREVNAETPAADRAALYRAGGVVAVTSRILVVDMLNKVLPLHLVTGVIVNNAERISETSHETFILRILRDSNKVAFIKAFTDAPEALTRGVWKLEKVMKLLFLRKVSFWPRFHMSITSAIEAAPPINLVEIRVAMTKNMQELQRAIIDCMDNCLAEIRRSSKSLDADELTVENSLFRNFEGLIRAQLDPIWHRVGGKIKQLINDVGTLRRLLSHIGSYDCVSFNSFLEAIRDANEPDPLAGIRGDLNISPWLLMDSTDTVFKMAKQRVFVRKTNSDQQGGQRADGSNPQGGASTESNEHVPSHIVPVLEEQPKWKALYQVLQNLESERRKLLEAGKSPGPILIMVDGDRTCHQLRELLNGFEITPLAAASISPTFSPVKKKRKRDVHPSSDDPHPPPAPPVRQSSSGDRRRKRGGGAATPIARPPLPATATCAATVPTRDEAPRFSAPGSQKMLTRLLGRYFRWRRVVPKVQRNLRFLKNRGRAVAGVATTSSRGGAAGGTGNGSGERPGFPGRGSGAAPGSSVGGRGTSTAFVRRRQRGGGSAGAALARGASDQTTFEEDAKKALEMLDALRKDDEGDRELFDLDDMDTGVDDGDASDAARVVRQHLFDPDAELDPDLFDRHFALVPAEASIVIRPYATTSSGSFQSSGDEDSRALESLAPRWVILYDVDVGFVRRLEVYQVTNPTVNLSVYFMVYDNSVEEQRYLSLLRKEKDAFERLIRDKSVMAIPIDQDGRIEMNPEEKFWKSLDTRLAGGQRIPANEANQVIVDVREFGSALPLLLYSQGLNLRPCTLEVGDYILTPSICVERKSLPDLAQSFKSGRLFAQAEAMCRHYRTPLLLIEFSQIKAFDAGLATSAVGVTSGGAATANVDLQDLGAKLVMLTLTFPRLRIVWSSSPAATAEIFEDLKRDQLEPSMEEAMTIGVDSSSTSDSVYSITPADMVRCLPGVTFKNYRYVMGRAPNLRALVNLPQDECEKILGPGPGKELYDFINFDPKRTE
ncbi:hypothetical protein DFJ73DRAFT_830901 [Zopfochytrium polystomum]|nr:hypothetical protein DFJ73DRAFT_830901 [Zopfochytrium polystomum]